MLSAVSNFVTEGKGEGKVAEGDVAEGEGIIMF